MTTQHPLFPYIHIYDFERRARRTSHQTGDMTIPDILPVVTNCFIGGAHFEQAVRVGAMLLRAFDNLTERPSVPNS